MKPKYLKIIEWNPRLAIGIKVIDMRHRTLLRITNDLFTSFLYDRTVADAYFRTIARRTVEFIRQHFIIEETMMEETRYPCLEEHRKQHREFIKELLKHIRRFETVPRRVPNRFARFLRNWILTHIAITDKKYGLYYHSLVEKRQQQSGAYSPSCHTAHKLPAVTPAKFARQSPEPWRPVRRFSYR